VGNNDLKPPWIGKKAYDKEHKRICELLHMDEVHANRVYRESVRKTGQKTIAVCYDPSGHVLSCTDKADPSKDGQARFRTVELDFPNSTKRVKRMVYLSHVLTQCGLRENAIRPLWRLLRNGYTMRYTNFSRLVHLIARLCNRRSDFTRNLGAPANGLRLIPRIMREAEPLLVKGIYVPRWTYFRHYSGNFLELNLD
jgi:hypothetical protein